MYPLESMNPRSAVARREELLRTIADYRHLAGPKLALDEARERALAEVARSRLLPDAGAVLGRRSPALRRRLGTALVAAGTRLQGAGGGALADPASAAATAPS